MKYTIEDIKKELSSYILEEQYIKERIEEIEELKTRTTKITSEISDMPRGASPVQDRIAETIVQILELEEENIKAIYMLKSKQAVINNIINVIDQPFKNILYYRYIKGYSLAEVSGMLGYEYKWTCTLHGKALEEYRTIRETRNVVI